MNQPDSTWSKSFWINSISVHRILEHLKLKFLLFLTTPCKWISIIGVNIISYSLLFKTSCFIFFKILIALAALLIIYKPVLKSGNFTLPIKKWNLSRSCTCYSFFDYFICLSCSEMILILLYYFFYVLVCEISMPCNCLILLLFVWIYFGWKSCGGLGCLMSFHRHS